MSNIRKKLKEESERIQEVSNDGVPLTSDDYSTLFLASIMEEERNECSNKEK